MGATDLCHPIATLTRHLYLWVWFKLCVINACCVFVCICYESNVCVWPCCSPDPLLVSVHITQFSANWITIYCFISLEHHLLLYSIGSSIHHVYKSITQLLPSHLCKLDHHQILLSRSLYQDFKCCPLLFPHFQFKSICVKRAKTKASHI